MHYANERLDGTFPPMIQYRCFLYTPKYSLSRLLPYFPYGSVREGGDQPPTGLLFHFLIFLNVKSQNQGKEKPLPHKGAAALKLVHIVEQFFQSEDPCPAVFLLIQILRDHHLVIICVNQVGLLQPELLVDQRVIPVRRLGQQI